MNPLYFLCSSPGRSTNPVPTGKGPFLGGKGLFPPEEGLFLGGKGLFPAGKDLFLGGGFPSLVFTGSKRVTVPPIVSPIKKGCEHSHPFFVLYALCFLSVCAATAPNRRYRKV